MDMDHIVISTPTGIQIVNTKLMSGGSVVLEKVPNYYTNNSVSIHIDISQHVACNLGASNSTVSMEMTSTHATLHSNGDAVEKPWTDVEAALSELCPSPTMQSAEPQVSSPSSARSLSGGQVKEFNTEEKALLSHFEQPPKEVATVEMPNRSAEQLAFAIDQKIREMLQAILHEEHQNYISEEFHPGGANLARFEEMTKIYIQELYRLKNEVLQVNSNQGDDQACERYFHLNRFEEIIRRHLRELENLCNDMFHVIKNGRMATFVRMKEIRRVFEEKINAYLEECGRFRYKMLHQVNQQKKVTPEAWFNDKMRM